VTLDWSGWLGAASACARRAGTSIIGVCGPNGVCQKTAVVEPKLSKIGDDPVVIPQS